MPRNLCFSPEDIIQYHGFCQFHLNTLFSPCRASNLLYPTFPDVKLRKLPFYKVLATLMQPCSLNPSGTARYQEQKFSFYLSPSQASEVTSSTYR